MDQSYTDSELAAAEQLEGYLAGLEQGALLPKEIATSDIALYRTARRLAVAKVQPRQLDFPLHKGSKLRSLALWLSPLPLVAAAILVYVNLAQPNTPVVSENDVSSDLAYVEQSDLELLALEQDLDQSLTEIDLLTSTDYIDQLWNAFSLLV